MSYFGTRIQNSVCSQLLTSGAGRLPPPPVDERTCSATCSLVHVLSARAQTKTERKERNERNDESSERNESDENDNYDSNTATATATAIGNW